MKRKNLVWSLVLTLLMLAILFSPSAFADGTVTASGTCGAQGDNLTWTLYDDGELVIEGTGDMADYNSPTVLIPTILGTIIIFKALRSKAVLPVLETLLFLALTFKSVSHSRKA